MRVVILRGVPGSGKSTVAKSIVDPLAYIVTVSADNYFMEDGAYKFDRNKLDKAHGRCLREFVQEVYGYWGRSPDLLIVDNTNTTVVEMAPYVAICNAYDVPFEVVTVDCDPALAAARNTHGVPVEKVWEMHRRLVAAQLPKKWPHRVVPATF